MSTQVASSIPAERVPRIWSRATLATLISMISIMVGIITVIAMIHLLIPRSGTVYLDTNTVGITDMPTRRYTPSGIGSVKTIFTGTRWTTFT